MPAYDMQGQASIDEAAGTSYTEEKAACANRLHTLPDHKEVIHDKS